MKLDLSQPWYFETLSANPAITIETLDVTKPFNWFQVSKNPAFNIAVVRANKHIPWDLAGLCENPNILPEELEPWLVSDILPNWLQPGWLATHLSRNPNINIRFVNKYPLAKWDWNELNKNMPLDECPNPRAHPQIRDLSRTGVDWDILALMKHAKVSFEYWLKHPQLNWYEMAKNQFYTVDQLLQSPYDIRDFLSDHRGLRLRHLTAKGWCYNKVSANPGITFEDILSRPDLPWQWSAVQQNPNVTMETVKNNPGIPWSWNSLSKNPNIKPEDIKRHRVCYQMLSGYIGIGRPSRLNAKPTDWWYRSAWGLWGRPLDSHCRDLLILVMTEGRFLPENDAAVFCNIVWHLPDELKVLVCAVAYGHTWFKFFTQN